MDKPDAKEATGIVQRMCTQLAGALPPSGDVATQARASIGDISANAYTMLRNDQLGPPLNEAFILVRAAGASYAQLELVRDSLVAEVPRTVGATLVQNVGIELCLATETEIIVSTTFVSRQDVDVMKAQISDPFNASIEIAADEMDQETFQALTALYGTTVKHLVSTARPLPRMLRYQFAEAMTTLTLAYRLYADASRADEVRDENKIVHPAFCPLTGAALSA
jgi:prophage DNA circulation protein